MCMDLEGLSAEETAAKLNEAHPQANVEKGAHCDHLVIRGKLVSASAFTQLRDARWYVSGVGTTVTFLHRHGTLD